MAQRITFSGLPVVPAEAGDTVAAYRGRQVVRVPVTAPGEGAVTSVGVSMPAGFAVANTPVTSAGTITVTFDAGYGLPTTAAMGQWSTAYGWGNHASAGYALASSVTSALAGKVDTSDARLTDAREWTAATVGQVEAEAGTGTTRRAWTAQRVRQAIAAWWAGTAEKLKLDGIQAGATANATDAQLRDRATHTGTQAISTIDGLAGALDGKVDKATGYGLSQENFTPAEKSKLAGLEGSRFKGVFASLAALQSGVPSPGAGDYADVDAGAGQDVSRYIWDTTDAEWVKQAGEVAPLTASQVKTLYESNPDTNAYTDAEKSKLAGVSAGATANTGTVTSVQVAVPTGLQVAGGPVTTSGTLTISYATGYSIPANSKQAQWDAAYGWGNHASAGYAAASHVHAIADVSGLQTALNSRVLNGSTVTFGGANTFRFTTSGGKNYVQSGDGSGTGGWLNLVFAPYSSGVPYGEITPDGFVGKGGGLTELNASNLNAGTVPDARLPARIGPTAQSISDWNSATSNGWYMSSTAANAPTGGWLIGHTENHGAAGWCTQTVHAFSGDTEGDTKTYRREQNNGAWGSWYRLRVSEAEQATLMAAYAYSKSQVDSLISAATSGAWVWQATTTNLPKNTPSKVDFSSPRTLTLPASPAENDYVAILKTAGDTTGSVVARNGQTIMGIAENMTIDSNICYLRLDFVNSSWRIAS